MFKSILIKLSNLFTFSLLNRVRHANDQLDLIIENAQSTQIKLDRLAETNLTLLNASIKISDNFSSNRKMISQINEEMETQLREIRSQLESTEQQKWMKSELTQLMRHQENMERTLTSVIQNLENRVSEDRKSAVIVETSDFYLANPEVGLISRLYSYLNSRTAFDVGAHKGEVAKQLSVVGYEVHAFEPDPEVFQVLKATIGEIEDCHLYNFAIGSKSGDLSLNRYTDDTEYAIFGDVSLYNSFLNRKMPEGLVLSESISVPVKTILEICESSAITKEIGVLKIDTEGFDLEVIRGLYDIRPSVVVAEYWDSDNPFGKTGTLYSYESLIGEMKKREYYWHIDLHRFWGNDEISFTCNYPTSARNSWGNLFFFCDKEQFDVAHQWCSETLPRTVFKHI